MTANNTGDWLDHLGDGTLFGCLFALGEIPEEMHVANAGMATKGCKPEFLASICLQR